ncbi:MAG TPA: hypothetical protein VGO58_04825 [Chitinophagaceae bacterium]|jgi:hypothetical protein|nr:hypothetical protein [Chitinophagaceae bacterium]
MKTEHQMNMPATQADRRSVMNGSRHPSSTTRLSDKAFYLIALAILLRRSAEPGTLQRYQVPGEHIRVPIRG